VELKKPFFIVAIALIALAVLVECGSLALSRDFPGNAPTPGYWIPHLALLDGLALFTMAIMGFALIIPERIHGRLQGVMTLVVSFLALFMAILLVVATITALFVMISLLCAPIFGTAAYFGIYSNFDRLGAAVILGLLMILKVGFAVCLFIAHPRFLQNKGLVLLVLTSFLAQILVSFLQGLPPTFLVSITDAIAGIVTAVLAAVWALVFLVGSLISIVRSLRVDRALA